jgi:hypothetical protein
LTRQTGQPPERWPQTIVKELIDNSIDAAEEAGSVAADRRRIEIAPLNDTRDAMQRALGDGRAGRFELTRHIGHEQGPAVYVDGQRQLRQKIHLRVSQREGHEGVPLEAGSGADNPAKPAGIKRPGGQCARKRATLPAGGRAGKRHPFCDRRSGVAASDRRYGREKSC